jgi:hypothetical protein
MLTVSECAKSLSITSDVSSLGGRHPNPETSQKVFPNVANAMARHRAIFEGMANYRVTADIFFVRQKSLFGAVMWRHSTAF